MEIIKTGFDAVAQRVAEIPQTGLLMLALLAMLVGWVGGMMIRRSVPLGRLVRGASTLVLVGVLLTVVLQVARLDPRFDLAVAEIGLPQQVVEGGETRVPLAADGHYWLQAEINGTRANFLVDTGATLTALSSETAQKAGIEPRRDRLPVSMSTANGTIRVAMTTIDEMRFGNVAARGLDAVIAPNLGETNVIGMNLLSRLAEWKVQNGVLVLVPNNPEPSLDLSGPDVSAEH
ncbi:TIGR02281 family clan AA aspartic protease [Erythrobacter jejuensis]|uniref:TIGR02281 family clan AA aspartic protease n=2 Tax=Parerythrobacter jejuensis TaxID=795812 RepID=A0A845AUQ0_9SPHN|nr:TIGR02281 family clan AA aspartic protease [Parerythrobacter jejuensis]